MHEKLSSSFLKHKTGKQISGQEWVAPILFSFFIFLSFSARGESSVTPEKIDPKLSQAVQKKIDEVGQGLLQIKDCPFLIQAYDPKDPDVFQFGYCMYRHEEWRGIFSASACVGVIVEAYTKEKKPFYGKDGHFGVEGDCVKERILSKWKEPQINSTVNPITAFRIKRKEGTKLRLLRDDLGLWDSFLEETHPDKKIIVPEKKPETDSKK